ncbi:MAG: hypothetical protein HYZ53_06245 [Planctomycetes bacterium]|nr:hypothetical protein [Planctomycetota bacterium]
MAGEKIPGSVGNSWALREDSGRSARQLIVEIADATACPLPVEPRFVEAFLDRISPAGPERIWEPRFLGSKDRAALFVRAGAQASALARLPLHVAYASYCYPEGGVFQLLLECELAPDDVFRVECPIDPATFDVAVRDVVQAILTVPVVPLVLLDDDLYPVATRELRHGPEGASAGLALWQRTCLHAVSRPHSFDMALERYYEENPEHASPLLDRAAAHRSVAAAGVDAEGRPARYSTTMAPTPPDAGVPAKSFAPLPPTGGTDDAVAQASAGPATRAASQPVQKGRTPTNARTRAALNAEELDRRLGGLALHYGLIARERLQRCIERVEASLAAGVETRLHDVLTADRALPAEVVDSLRAFVDHWVPNTTGAIAGAALSRQDLRVASILILQQSVAPERIHKAIITQWRVFRAEGSRCELTDALRATGDVRDTEVHVLRGWIEALGPSADTRRLLAAVRGGEAGGEAEAQPPAQGGAPAAPPRVTPGPMASATLTPTQSPAQAQTATPPRSEAPRVDASRAETPTPGLGTDARPAALSPRAPDRPMPVSAQLGQRPGAETSPSPQGRPHEGEGAATRARALPWRVGAVGWFFGVIGVAGLLLAQLVVSRVRLGSVEAYLDCRDNLRRLSVSLSAYVQRYGSGVSYPGTTPPAGDFHGPGHDQTPNGIFWAHLARLPRPADAVLRYPAHAHLLVCPAHGTPASYTALDYSAPNREARWLPGLGSGPVFPGGDVTPNAPGNPPLAGELPGTDGSTPHTDLPSSRASGPLWPVLFLDGQVDGLAEGSDLWKQYRATTVGTRSR